jgi:hypothetical protein
MVRLTFLKLARSRPYLLLSVISCYEFRLHNDFAESFVTRGLSPLPVCVLDN